MHSKLLYFHLHFPAFSEIFSEITVSLVKADLLNCLRAKHRYLVSSRNLKNPQLFSCSQLLYRDKLAA